MCKCVHTLFFFVIVYASIFLSIYICLCLFIFVLVMHWTKNKYITQLFVIIPLLSFFFLVNLFLYFSFLSFLPSFIQFINSFIHSFFLSFFLPFFHNFNLLYLHLCFHVFTHSSISHCVWRLPLQIDPSVF